MYLRGITRWSRTIDRKYSTLCGVSLKIIFFLSSKKKSKILHIVHAYFASLSSPLILPFLNILLRQRQELRSLFFFFFFKLNVRSSDIIWVETYLREYAKRRLAGFTCIVGRI